MKKPLNIKMYTILQNGNKHLRKRDVITPIYDLKKFKIRPTTPTEYFCSTSIP